MYICHYFESPLAIYQVGCWFLSSRIQLVLSSKSFTQTFSSDLLENFFSSKTFSREWKRWKSYATRSAELVGKQTKSNNFTCMILELSWRCTMFLAMMNMGCFLWRFSCTHCSWWEYKSECLFTVQKLKSYNTMVILPCTQHNFSSMKLYFGIGYKDSS